MYTKEDLTKCLMHYDAMQFNSIKLSEIQHGKDVFVSFDNIFNYALPSAYSHGCQTYINTEKILPGFKTPLLLKRSCFLCEESLTASISDGVKMIYKIFKHKTNKYSVVYENGLLTGGWI